jgi:hypothetical protein
MATPTLMEPASGQVNPNDLPWALWMEGLEVKMLRCNLSTGEYTLMVRYSGGDVDLPRHKHFGPVHAWTVQGTWGYLEYDWVATTGSYVYEPAGSIHTLRAHATDEDVIVIYAMSGGLIMLGPDDELWMMEDAATALERYQLALEQQGEQMPEGILE